LRNDTLCLSITHFNLCRKEQRRKRERKGEIEIVVEVEGKGEEGEVREKEECMMIIPEYH